MNQRLTQTEVNEQKVLYDKWLNSFDRPQSVEKTAFGIWLASAKANKGKSIPTSDNQDVENLTEAMGIF